MSETGTPLPGDHLTEQLATFVARTRFADLGPEPSALALDLLVDGVGVGIAGACSPELTPLTRYAQAAASPGPVPAPGVPGVDVGLAAYLSGAAIHVLDYDDIIPEMGHSAAVLVSSALALAHFSARSGEQVLTGIAVGAEVGARLGRAMNPTLYESGWHPTSVLGAVAAAATAASMLELDPSRTAHALGLAGAMASGMKASIGSMGKCVQVGAAARTGVESALMAQAGVTGNETMFDPQFGAYVELFAADADRPALVQDLGSTFEFVRQGVRIKFLPCCGSIHSPVFAILKVMQENGLTASDISRVVTEVAAERLPHTDRPVVQTSLAGKFSMQYCQAVAALTGRLTLSDFTPSAVLEESRQHLMTLIELRAAQMPVGTGPSTGSRAARVTVTTRDGKEFEYFVPAPRGSKYNPGSAADLDQKFLECVGDHRTSGDASSMLSALRSAAAADADEMRRLVADVWSV